MTAPGRACAAPHSALYLDPTGLVSACCANSAYTLGRITPGASSDSLRSIWDGARTAALRQALDSGDFSLGCAACASGGAHGSPATLARDFDQFWDAAGSEYPSYMDLAMSNTCNLQCVMCNGDLSSAIRSRREGRAPLRSPYGPRFFEELAEFLPHVEELSFKGGEPFLSHEASRVWDQLLELDARPAVTVTTNGTIWSDRVERYVRDLAMDVVVSVDGASATTVEAIRVGADLGRLHQNLRRFRSATQDSGASLVLNYCLMPQNVHEFGEFLAQADDLGASVHIVDVSAPAEYDLLGSDRDRLAGVLESLQQQSTAVEARLGANVGVWRHQLDRIRDAVAAARSPQDTAVHLQPSPAQLEAIRSDLETTSGAAVLALDFQRGVLTEVESPDWAPALFDPSDWLGMGARDLPGRIADSLRLGFPEVRMEPIGPSAMRATLTFDSPGGTVEIIGAAIIDPGTGRPRKLLICEPVRPPD